MYENKARRHLSGIACAIGTGNPSQNPSIPSITPTMASNYSMKSSIPTRGDSGGVRGAQGTPALRPQDATLSGMLGEYQGGNSADDSMKTYGGKAHPRVSTTSTDCPPTQSSTLCVADGSYGLQQDQFGASGEGGSTAPDNAPSTAKRQRNEVGDAGRDRGPESPEAPTITVAQARTKMAEYMAEELNKRMAPETETNAYVTEISDAKIKAISQAAVKFVTGVMKSSDDKIKDIEWCVGHETLKGVFREALSYCLIDLVKAAKNIKVAVRLKINKIRELRKIADNNTLPLFKASIGPKSVQTANMPASASQFYNNVCFAEDAVGTFEDAERVTAAVARATKLALQLDALDYEVRRDSQSHMSFASFRLLVQTRFTDKVRPEHLRGSVDHGGFDLPPDDILGETPHSIWEYYIQFLAPLIKDAYEGLRSHWALQWTKAREDVATHTKRVEEVKEKIRTVPLKEVTTIISKNLSGKAQNKFQAYRTQTQKEAGGPDFAIDWRKLHKDLCVGDVDLENVDEYFGTLANSKFMRRSDSKKVSRGSPTPPSQPRAGGL